jgi:hypothetical protein
MNMTVPPSVRLVGHVRSAPAPPPAPPGATVQIVGSSFAGLVGRPGGGRRDAVGPTASSHSIANDAHTPPRVLNQPYRWAAGMHRRNAADRA